MTAPLSTDLRRRLVRAVEAGSSAREAARRFEVSPSAAIKLMQRVRATGSAAPAKVGGYRKPLLAGHEALLHELTMAKPGITLAEVQAELTGRGIQAGSLATIWSTLRRLGLRHKNVWPAPSASGFTTWYDQSTPTYPVTGHRPGQDGDPRVLVLIKSSASSAIFWPGFQNADRLSGHLVSTTRRPHTAARTG
ncbi:transposase [Paeniroseomonas aquatica]|uniref:helix-turn-helix domain-containing protein n=1 Tax=Paeniroseomonas aquatica TaxID=373043 RepID=UPI00360BD055